MPENESPDFLAQIEGFEWDEIKDRSNITKHGIGFADATEVFTDPKQYTYRSSRHANEVRNVSVGMARGRLIAVIFTRRGNNIRVISARAARRAEREQYG
jgi:uncharacterized protein